MSGEKKGPRRGERGVHVRVDRSVCGMWKENKTFSFFLFFFGLLTLFVLVAALYFYGSVDELRAILKIISLLSTSTCSSFCGRVCLSLLFPRVLRKKKQYGRSE